jgi:vancomycin permeability regulator SanA
LDWKRLAHQFFRTAGAAIAAFIVLNALGDILLPRFGADFLWIVFPEWLRIPGRIVLLGAAASLGWAAARPLLRKRVFVAAQALLLIVAFAAFVNVIAFYFLLLGGRVASRFPVPSSLLVVAVMVMNVRRIRIEHALGRRIDADETPLRLGVVHGASLAGVSVLAPLILVLAYGTTDYSHMAGGERAPVDCIVVYGAKVHEDGSLSLALADRVRHGVHLFNDGRGRRLVMSGGTNADGTSEPRSMKRFAVDLGVPADAIILDEAGLDTYRSAVGVRKLMDERGWRLSISVSHYYHLLRIQMAARRAGLATLTVPCRMSRRLAKEPWFLAREIAAFYLYHFLRWGEPADVEPPEEGPVPLQLP